jgi:hypothetical protein
MARHFSINGDTFSPRPPHSPRGRYVPDVGWWSLSLTRRAREIIW